MANDKHGLGRGLDALFGEETEDGFSLDALGLSENGVESIDVSLVKTCVFQPRQNFDKESLKELAESIKQKGVLQPILVRKKQNQYEIVAGERRFRATLMAGLKKIPAIVKEFDDRQAFEIALIENIVRQNLSPIEEAKGFEKLTRDFHYTHEDLSKSIGKSRSYISNMMRLLNLPNDVQDKVNSGILSASHARVLAGVENASELAEKIVSKDLNVRQTEDLINKIKQGKMPKKSIQKNTEIKKIEENLEKKYGVKAEISFNPKGRGKIVLKYKNFSELENLLNKLEK